MNQSPATSTKVAEPPLGAPPRKAKLRPGIRRFRRASRLVFVLIMLVLGGWAVLDGLRLHELVYRTQNVSGTVTKKFTAARAGVRGLVDYRLAYHFTTQDGIEINSSASVPMDVHETIKEGQSITVVYLPDRSTVDHWLFSSASARTYPQYMLIGRVSAILIALMVMWLIDRPLRRELFLARYGDVAAGQIVTTGKANRRRARPWITYTFRTASGVIVEGRCTVPRTISPEARAAGTPIEVLYDALQPSRNKARLGLEFVEFG